MKFRSKPPGIHGISTEKATKEGIPLAEAVQLFDDALAKASYLVGHNLEYDIRLLKEEYERLKKPCRLGDNLPVRDTMYEGTDYTAIQGKGRRYKYPKLTELYEKIFGRAFPSAHDAAFDVAATAACFFALLEKGVLAPSDDTTAESIAYGSACFF